jgi:hypothetical protein
MAVLLGGRIPVGPSCCPVTVPKVVQAGDVRQSLSMGRQATYRETWIVRSESPFKGGVREETSSDVSGNWEPIPEFTQITGLLRAERNVGGRTASRTHVVDTSPLQGGAISRVTLSSERAGASKLEGMGVAYPGSPSSGGT